VELPLLPPPHPTRKASIIADKARSKTFFFIANSPFVFILLIHICLPSSPELYAVVVPKKGNLKMCFKPNS
jgi:hypothetical protein